MCLQALPSNFHVSLSVFLKYKLVELVKDMHLKINDLNSLDCNTYFFSLDFDVCQLNPVYINWAVCEQSHIWIYPAVTLH